MNLESNTIQIVKSTAPLLAEQGEKITGYFYQRMFSQHPELLNMFNATNQHTGRQQAALAAAVYGYAAHIDNLEKLTDAVTRIANKHASLNVKPEHYPIVGEHLLAAVAHVLGEAATEEILSAWSDAYHFLADLFISVEESIYQKGESCTGGWRGKREVRVVSKVRESEQITSFYLRSTDNQPLADFKPGQYISVHVKPQGCKNQCIRQYSLSDTPSNDFYRISVKREGEEKMTGVVSSYLHESVIEGDKLDISPPMGDFSLDTSEKSPIVLCAGGIGVTPLLSMFNQLTELEWNEPVFLVHSVVNGHHHPFASQLEQRVSENKNAQVFFYYNRPESDDTRYHFRGQTDLNMIREKIDLPNARYYFCGPVGYMSMINRTLKSWGVPAERRHYEVFGPHCTLD